MISQDMDYRSVCCMIWSMPCFLSAGHSLCSEFKEASLCLGWCFFSPLHTMKSIGLDPCSCPHQTTSRQDMAAPNPREICPSRRKMKRGKRGTFKDILCLSLSLSLSLSHLLLFSGKWGGREGCCCTCSQGAVRTLIFRFLLVSLPQIR